MKTNGSGLRQTLIAASVAACFTLPSPTVANPTGPAVIHGSASFATAGSTLTVTNSANTVIHWQGFSIGVNEITRFLQSSAGSAVLNRVVGSGGVIPQSVIDGVLQSNGRVFLLNPMGVVIGPSARIDVAGLVASSLNLSNEDFLAGRMRFTEVPGAGGIANGGTIETTSGGRVYLVAPDVQNSGIIRAPQGEIVLAAGKSAELVSEGSPFVQVRVTAESEQALNVGKLVADSGRIGMYGALVRNAGVAEATGAVTGPGGQIRFIAGKDLTLDARSRTAANGTTGGEVLLQATGGTNLISGTVEATGNAGKGGNVQALGVRVGVLGHGVIDASGETGGGTVLVGGDYQGKNPAIQNAERTYIGPDGVIRADAGTTGDGGRVIVWADETAQFYGNISARGGAQSGNGGFVETSGKGALHALGAVDTGAPKGGYGTWLLDPTNLDVISGTDALGDYYVGTFGAIFSGDAPSQVGRAAIEGYGGLVTLQASNNVSFLTDIDKSNGGLTVLAGNEIALNNSVIRVAGPLSMQAGNLITSTIAPGTTQLRTDAGSGGEDRRVQLTLTGPSGWINTGGIITGNASGSNAYTSVYVQAYDGIRVYGNITTGAALGGAGTVADSGIYLRNYTAGDIQVSGNIASGAASLVATGGTASSTIRLGGMSGVGGVFVGGSMASQAASGPSAYADITICGGFFCSGTSSASVGGGITTGSANATNGMANNSIGVWGSSGVTLGGALVSGTASSPTTQATSYINVHSSGTVGIGGNVMTGAATGLSYSDSGVSLGGSAGLNVAGNIVTGNSLSATGSAYSTAEISGGAAGASISGQINTGSAVGTYALSSVYGSVTGGTFSASAIATGDASNNTSVSVSNHSGGSIAIGAVQTGNSATGNTFVNLYAPYGGLQTGSVSTGSGDPYYGNTYLNLVSGAAGTVTGQLTTGGGYFSGVYVSSNGDVSIGGIITGPGTYSSHATLIGQNVNSGPISTGGAPASWVYMSAYGNAIASSIFTGAGNDSGIHVSAAGSVQVGNAATGGGGTYAGIGYYAQGNISSGSIATGTAQYSSVWLDAQGDVDAGPIGTGPSSFDGSVGIFGHNLTTQSIATGPSPQSYVGLFATGNILGGTINTSSGAGDASVIVEALGNVALGGVATGSGSSDGSILLLSEGGSVSAGTLATGSGPSSSIGILAPGGGVMVGDLLAGTGPVSLVIVSAGGDIGIGNIVTRSGDPSFAGGVVHVQSHNGSVKLNGLVDTRGADGTASHIDGSAGGSVYVSAPGTITFGPTPSPTAQPKIIDTSGGAGAPGGAGGDAGDVTIDPTSILLNGSIFAVGGAGNGAPGGAGGNLLLQTTGGSGTITFVNGGYDITGGAGSPAGANGAITAEGTLIFVTLLTDVFSNPTVAQSIGATVQELLAAAPAGDPTGDTSDPTDPEKQKTKKGSASSCRP